MSVSSAAPLFYQFFLPGAVGPLSGGKLFTYQAGTSTKQATWTDSTQTVQNANPIILDSNGICQMWGDPTLIYKLVLAPAKSSDPPTTIYYSQDNFEFPVTASSVVAVLGNTGSGIGQALWPRSKNEITASIVPSNYAFVWGDPRRYGAVLDGVTDDSAALIEWAEVGGNLSFPPLTALISQTITGFISNTTIAGSYGAEILCATGGISLFSFGAVTTVEISCMKFINTAATTSFPTTFAHCNFVGSNYCTVRDCRFEGMNCGAIQFDGVASCHADNNYILNGNYPTNQQQTFDIALFGYTGNSVGCTITNNKCFGGGNFGIANQNAYSGFIPVKNVISNNRIGGCQLYGILVYQPGVLAAAPVSNSNVQVIGNYVENIQGTASIISGEGGAGIYVVGTNAGGTLVANNTIVNCCINTVGRGLAPAGIGISDTAYQITFQSSVGGVATGQLTVFWAGVSGSFIVQFSNGQQKLAVFTNGSETVSWTGNLSAGTITTANAQTPASAPIVVSGNIISGMNQYDGILIISSLNGVSVIGNTVTMPSANVTGNALHVENSSFVTSTGNTLFNNGTAATIYLDSTPTGSNCVNCSFTGNTGFTSGTIDYQASGTLMSGCFYTNTNSGTGTIVNNCAGSITHTLVAAVPSAGTYQKGDILFNTVPASTTGVFAWMVTTLGAVGTAVFTPLNL